MILKVVGYAESITDYYKIDDLKAHVWIAHQRFPTKGRVWHPGGAHPFGVMNTALVHNGDFANYSSVCEYLVQRNIYPQFLTDTEVSVQIFDLLDRIYHYPLGIHHRISGAYNRIGFRQAVPKRSSPSTVQFRQLIFMLHRTVPGSLLSPAPCGQLTNFSSWVLPIPPCSARRCSLLLTVKYRSA